MSNVKTASIIEKWYKKLNFPKSFDAEFYEALESIEISPDTVIESYDLNSEDGKRNLLSFLYMCEALEKKYKEKGISEEILMDTLADIKRWCEVWTDLCGSLALHELTWLVNHLSFTLFKLGRLQGNIEKAPIDVPGLGIKKDDPVIGLHVPREGPLDIGECKKSIDRAREFFGKYFPEVDFRYFSCHSWLLDDTLRKFLPEDSNIIRFGDMFFKVLPEKKDSILSYIFRWKITREEAKTYKCTSAFAEKVQKYINDGGEFFDTLGFLKR